MNANGSKGLYRLFGINRDRLPIIFSWAGILAGVILGIFSVYYLDIRGSLDRFCVLGIAVMGFQVFGSTIGGAWGKPELQSSVSGLPPIKHSGEDDGIRNGE